MEQNLLFKRKTPVELKESYGGFEVCNSEHIDFEKVNPKTFRWGSEILKLPNHTKKDFEETIKKEYGTDIVWINTKFQDNNGFFYLNDVKVKWKLKTGDIGDYHLEFDSDEIPNLITDTGYRSDFLNEDYVNEFNSFEEVLKSEIERLINYDDVGKKNKKQKTYDLKFEGILIESPKSVNKEKDTLQEQQVSEDVERSYLNISVIGNLITEQKLYTSSSLDKPRNQLGSWSSSGEEIKGTNEEILEYILNFLKNNLKKPYAETETPFTTTLKIENCHIEISKQAKEFLIKKEFDFKKFEEEEKKLKSSQKIATQEDLAKAKTFELMEKSMDKLRDECYAIKNYFENFLNFRKQREKNPYYLEQMKKFGIDYSDLNKLKELYDNKAKVYKIYYCKVYEMRWGKPCDEEYSNV